jgi:hypothetical protein
MENMTDHNEPMAYYYDNADHCPACTFARFGHLDQEWLEKLEDSNGGQLVGFGYEDSEWYDWRKADQDQTLECADCGTVIAEREGDKPAPVRTVRTADGVDVTYGARVFDYNEGLWGTITNIDEDGWFDLVVQRYYLDRRPRSKRLKGKSVRAQGPVPRQSTRG